MREFVKACTGARKKEDVAAWSEAAAEAIISKLTDNQIRALFRFALESDNLTRSEKIQITELYFSI